MGIFDSLTDAFTGRPAKEAAAKNTALLQANQANGTTTLQNNQTAGTGILQSNLAAGTTALQNNQAAGTTALQNGQTGALDALDAAKGEYAPLAAKYGAGTGLYLDSLGVNGPEGNTRATGAFQAGPGYRYAVDQSLDGINRHAAASGISAGGNTLAALSDRAGNMANQEYGNWQGKLGGLISPEEAAVAGMAGADTNRANVLRGTGQDIAGLGTSTTNGIVNLGTTTAGGLADLGTHTADSIVGLGTNTTNGINGQTTQAANAEMAGSANLWGAGLNLAKLGIGAATGGTSLLGGGGLNLTKLGFNPIAGAAGA